MDWVTFFEKALVYMLLIFPLLTIILLVYWSAANMQKTAKAQLAGILSLIVLGFIAMNFPLFWGISVIVALTLLVVWGFAYHKYFNKVQLPFILGILALQIIYYPLFMKLTNPLISILLCLIPIISLIMLWPWTIGSKKTTRAWTTANTLFALQAISTLLHAVFFVIIFT